MNFIAKHIPDLNATITSALEADPELRQLYVDDAEAAEVIDMAKN